MQCDTKKIGILGGTFNPIHVGHLILAQNALDYYKLDSVMFIPAGVSYFKNQDEIVKIQHRLNMVQLAINDNDRFSLSTIETDRAGNSYTYETLDILKKENPNVHYYYIIGADTLFKIDTWKNPGDIFSKCTLCCQKREGYLDDEIQSRKKYLEENYGASIEIMDVPEILISSTFVRNSIKNGCDLRYYLTKPVMEYIKDNRLYYGNDCY